MRSTTISTPRKRKGGDLRDGASPRTPRFDGGGIKKADNIPPLLAALARFDEIFAVLNDDDGPKMKQVFDWAPTEGRGPDVSGELRDSGTIGPTLRLHDIEKKIAAMEAARQRPQLQSESDALRAELTGASIVIEQYEGRRALAQKVTRH
jgi:hypothetical protein